VQRGRAYSVDWATLQMEVRMLATALLVAVATGSVPVTAAMAGGDRAMWRHGEAPALAALPRSGEGWLTLAVRLCGDVKAAAALREANARLSHPLKDVRVVVPWSILREDLRVTVVQVLFPADRRVTSGWEHQIRAPWGGDGESWWELAEWFCGEGSLYPRVRDANPGAGMFPVRGTRILILRTCSCRSSVRSSLSQPAAVSSRGRASLRSLWL